MDWATTPSFSSTNSGRSLGKKRLAMAATVSVHESLEEASMNPSQPLIRPGKRTVEIDGGTCNT